MGGFSIPVILLPYATLFQSFAVQVSGAGMAGDLGHHQAVAVVVEVDLGDAGQGKIEARAEYIIGDVHDAAEDRQTRTVVGEQRDALGGFADDMIAVVLAVVAQTLLLQPSVHGGVDAVHACLVAGVLEIGVGVPLSTQGVDLGGDELADGGGHLQNPLLVAVGIYCVEVLKGVHLVGPIAEDGLLALQTAGGHRGLHRTVGGGGVDAVEGTAQEPLGQRFGLLFAQGGEAVGIVDGLAVTDEIQFHVWHSFSVFFRGFFSLYQVLPPNATFFCTRIPKKPLFWAFSTEFSVKVGGAG